MKKQMRKLALTKETVKNLDRDLVELAMGGADTVGNTCFSICAASRIYACFSPQTGG